MVRAFFLKFMYNLQKNNYHLKPKASNIQTPLSVSQFIFELLRDKFPKKSLVLDPCSGKGNLLEPWKDNGYPTWGIDIDPNSKAKAKMDFFTLKPYESEWNLEVNLVLCNPPFNGYKGKAAAEVWLDKIIELFGKDIPLVLFAPYNFRLPWKSDSKRLSKFLSGEYPPIASIISLPTKGLWEGVIFHSEILIFNVPNLQSHYFFKESCPN